MNPPPCPHCGKPVRAWRVQLIDGAFWTCHCERDPETEPMCHVPYPAAANTEDEAVAAWNRLARKGRRHA